MKSIFLIVLILLVQTAHSEFIGEVDYSVIYNSSNEYTTSVGSRFSTSASTDARYLGLGFRYIFRDVFTKNLNIEPLAKAFLPAKDRDINSLNFYELGSSVSYSFSQHQPFLSLMMTLANDSDSPLTYTYGIGYQLGYRYNFNEKHLAFISHSWKTLNSANESGGVFDQESTISLFSLGYGYRFF